jgi:hypothetical protein
MAAEKDAGLIEVILLRQHPNHTLPAIVQTSVQRKIRRRLLSPTKSRWTVTIVFFMKRKKDFLSAPSAACDAIGVDNFNPLQTERLQNSGEKS